MRLRKQLEVLSLTLLLATSVVAKKDAADKKDGAGINIKEAQQNTDKYLKKTPPPEFIEMEPFTVSVLKNGAAIAFLRIEIVLEAHDVEGAETVKLVLPKIRDVVLVDLHGAMSKFWITSSEPSMFALKKRIERVIEERIFAKNYSIKGKLVNKDMIKSIQIKNMALQHVE